MSENTTTTGQGTTPAPVSRRRGFLKALGLGAGAAGLASTGLSGSALAQAGGINDIDIMNFALNLEYLEAEYYTLALTGKSIEDIGIPTFGLNTGGGNPGPLIVKANPMVPFTPGGPIQQYATEIALDEQKHVQFFRNTIAAFGAQPVARPTIDLLNSFNTLGNAIGIGNFDPFANETNFLLGAYIFEDVGVSAFHGAARLIKNKDVLDAAAGILAIEAYHAGLIRTILFQMGQGPATDLISNLRKALGGSVDYGVDNGPLAMGPKGTSSIVLADNNAIAPERTTRQVLNIVYGGVNAQSGLFYPNALNGKIR